MGKRLVLLRCLISLIPSPISFGQVFHPQPILHGLIAEAILQEMEMTNLVNNGFPAITNNLDLDLSLESCPYSPPGGGEGGQQIAIASYTNPLGDPTAWERLISYDSKKLSILVANVLNGPNYVVDASWNSVI
ncbi:MAG: hypothetical protein CL912_14645 [Deltaproteobacteria bacterium]|nr:hypothetical protein [Deltaproteobacteria bacterium]|tara:strand:- start:1180 stop:1578 length:399 start_codon:yes stop_codon:yes gene_type:complete